MDINNLEICRREATWQNQGGSYTAWLHQCRWMFQTEMKLLILKNKTQVGTEHLLEKLCVASFPHVTWLLPFLETNGQVFSVDTSLRRRCHL